MHHRLIDILLHDNAPSNWFLICLLCQKPLYYRYLNHPTHRSTTIKFRNEPLESVIVPVNFQGLSPKLLVRRPCYAGTVRIVNVFS